MSLPDKQNLNEITPTDAASTWATTVTIVDLNTIVGSSINQLSPTALAYIGDAVYELYIRTRFLMPPKRMTDYHSQVVAQVKAESQAAHLTSLEPHLTIAEREILRRGRNACGSKPRRISGRIYQRASSLETLIGYLHLTDPQRLAELLAKIEFNKN
ncbi:MAG: Mini-ribonuclease 3 [Pleurocapsa sp.]